MSKYGLVTYHHAVLFDTIEEARAALESVDLDSDAVVWHRERIVLVRVRPGTWPKGPEIIATRKEKP